MNNTQPILLLVLTVVLFIIWWWNRRSGAKPDHNGYEASPLKGQASDASDTDTAAHASAGEDAESLPILIPLESVPLPEAETPATATEAGPAEPAPAKTAPAEADDLQKIEGIGPKTASALHAAGITTYAQLAGMKPDAIKQVITDGGVRSGDPATWPQQAKLAAEGKWDKLKTLQDKLQGGRKT